MVRGHLTIRPVVSADLPEVDALIELGFGGGSRPLANDGAAPAGELRFVAVRNGIVGFGAARGYGVAAYVGPLVVHPSARRSGIASELLRTLVKSLESMGVRTLLLDATAGNAPFYERFGFTSIDATDVYERRVDAELEPPVEPVESDALSHVLAIDRRITGCDRSAAFAAFAREPSAWLALRPNGYLLTRGRVLGPWLADDATTAADMLASALAARPASSVAYVPRSNLDAPAILRDAGFERDRSLCHLGYGASTPMRRAYIYGQASLGHG